MCLELGLSMFSTDNIQVWKILFTELPGASSMKWTSSFNPTVPCRVHFPIELQILSVPWRCGLLTSPAIAKKQAAQDGFLEDKKHLK